MLSVVTIRSERVFGLGELTSHRYSARIHYNYVIFSPFLNCVCFYFEKDEMNVCCVFFSCSHISKTLYSFNISCFFCSLDLRLFNTHIHALYLIRFSLRLLFSSLAVFFLFIILTWYVREAREIYLRTIHTLRENYRDKKRK